MFWFDQTHISIIRELQEEVKILKQKRGKLLFLFNPFKLNVSFLYTRKFQKCVNKRHYYD